MAAAGAPPVPPPRSPPKFARSRALPPHGGAAGRSSPPSLLRPLHHQDSDRPPLPPKMPPFQASEPPLRLYNSDPGKLDPLDLIRNRAAAAIFLLSTDAALAHHLSRTADVVLRGYSGYNTRWARMVMDRVLDGLAPPLAATVFFGANDASLPDRSSGHQSVPLAEYQDNLRSICTSLKELRSQLYSAAEYFEVSYKNDEQKQIVVSTLKDYAVKALVNTVDHLGSVSFKVNDILDEKVDEVSGTEFRVSCIEQRLRTCQEYINREGLSQQSLVITAPKYHKRYILPVVPKQNMESTTPSSSPASCRLEASTLDEFSMQQSFLFSDSLHVSNGAHGQLSPSTSPWMTEPTSIQAYPHHFIPESADLPIQNSLIDIYVRFSNRDSARKVSDEMPEEDVWHCRVWC